MKYLQTDATVSRCGRYRYDLVRVWDAARPRCVFLMLNPSTADGADDDPTVRKCVGFADRAGCGALTIVNLFAFRATYPTDLFGAADPVGPDNDRVLLAHCDVGAFLGPVVAAWGAAVEATRRPVIRDRPHAVRRLLDGVPLKCYGLTALRNPTHPLMLAYDRPLRPLEAPRAQA